MAFEIKLGNRLAKVELLNRAGDDLIFQVDETRYEVSIVEVERGIYSILYDGKSYNIELVEEDAPKKYLVNTFRSSFEVEIIDAESKYLKSREKGIEEESASIISTPMPGKIVKVLVKEGEEVTTGQTVLIVEAMKMQNEYQVKRDTRIREILVKEGDTINAHQPLIILE